MTNKVTERLRLNQLIKNLKPEYRTQADLAINQKVIDFLATQKPQGIGIYLHRTDEVSTSYLYDWLLKHGWTVYAPKVQNKNLHFYQIQNQNHKLIWKKQLNIWEPDKKNPKAEKFSIIIIPLVGYNENNFRLGRGGGHYDRWLQNNQPQLAIGLAYKEQLVSPKVAFNSYDFPLNLIINNEK